MFGRRRRATLTFPSPYLRNAPTTLVDRARRVRRRRVVASRRGHLLRERLQGGAGRLPRRGDRGRRGADRRRRRRRATSRCARPSSAASSSGAPIERPTEVLSGPPRAESVPTKGRESMKVTVANAPISYGAFELTVGIDPNVPDGEQVLDEVTRAGLRGHRPRSRGLPRRRPGAGRAPRRAAASASPARTWSSPSPTPTRCEALYPELDAMLDTFDAVRSRRPGPGTAPDDRRRRERGAPRRAGSQPRRPVARTRQRGMGPA